MSNPFEKRMLRFVGAMKDLAFVCLILFFGTGCTKIQKIEYDSISSISGVEKIAHVRTAVISTEKTKVILNDRAEVPGSYNKKTSMQNIPGNYFGSEITLAHSAEGIFLCLEHPVKFIIVGTHGKDWIKLTVTNYGEGYKVGDWIL